MPKRARSGVDVFVISLPPNFTVPAEAFHNPMIVRKHVVLPAPLRPRSIVSDFSGTEKSTPCRMWYCPIWVFTPASWRSSATDNAQVGFLHDRRGDHLGGLAVGDELALVQH